jgi:transcription initiation factor IIE alpha subunit
MLFGISCWKICIGRLNHAMGSTKDRLYSGLYECTECDARYNVEDASEDDLVCDECGADLVMEEEHDEDEDDEESDAA